MSPYSEERGKKVLLSIVFSAFIICTSILLGKVLCTYFSLNEKFLFSFPLGFTVLIGLLQLIYYPGQIMLLSFDYFLYVTLILIALVWLVIIINIKKLRHVYACVNKKELIIGLVVCASFFLVCCLIYSKIEFQTRYDDLYFYMPTIKDKIDSSSIPKLSAMYQFAGIYDFYAVVSKIINALSLRLYGTSYLVIGTTSWVGGILLYMLLSTTIYNLFYICKSKAKCKLVPYVSLIVVILITLSSYWYFQTPYLGNSMRRLTLIIPILLLSDKGKEMKLTYKLLISVCFFGLTAQTSTGLIFIVCIVYAYLIYALFMKLENYIHSIAVIALPGAIMLSLYLPYTFKAVLGIYLVYTILTVTKKVQLIEKFFNVHKYKILLGVPVLFALISLWLNQTPNSYVYNYFTIDDFNFFDSHEFEGIVHLFDFKFITINDYLKTIFCVGMWAIIIANIIKEKKEKTKDFNAYLIGVVLLTFFNPLVFRFVVNNMTGIVYFRLYDLFFNPLSIMIGMGWICSLISSKWLKCVFLAIIIGVSIPEVQKNQSWIGLQEYSDSYNVFYHTSNDEIEVFQQLEKFITSGETPVVASQIYSSDVFADYPIINIKDNILVYPDSDLSNEAELQRILYRHEPGLREVSADHIQACILMQEKNVEYVILDAQYNPNLESGVGYCGEKIFEVGAYRVFKLDYSWLSWSMPWLSEE